VTGWVSRHAGDRILFANALAFATLDQPRNVASVPTFVASDEASFVTDAPVVAGGGVATVQR
jgi:hypothetical protein